MNMDKEWIMNAHAIGVGGIILFMGISYSLRMG